jgi:hypothetical protein
VSRKFVNSRCIILLLLSYLPVFLNASRATANDLMPSNVQEWTQFLLVSTPRSHLYNFCATDVNSGLATRVTLTRVPWERSVTRRWTWFGFIFVLHYVIVVGLRFKLYNLYILHSRYNEIDFMPQHTLFSMMAHEKRDDARINLCQGTVTATLLLLH